VAPSRSPASSLPLSDTAGHAGDGLVEVRPVLIAAIQDAVAKANGEGPVAVQLFGEWLRSAGDSGIVAFLDEAKRRTFGIPDFNGVIRTIVEEAGGDSEAVPRKLRSDPDANAELFTMLWNALILSIAAALEALFSEECARWRRQTKDQEMSEPPTGG